MNIHKVKTMRKLQARQAAIRPESDEDEGAAEHYAEIQSVIDVIEKDGSDQEIKAAAEYVSLESDLVSL